MKRLADIPARAWMTIGVATRLIALNTHIYNDIFLSSPNELAIGHSGVSTSWRDCFCLRIQSRGSIRELTPKR
jgi:hypothetical protein